MASQAENALNIDRLILRADAGTPHFLMLPRMRLRENRRVSLAALSE